MTLVDIVQAHPIVGSMALLAANYAVTSAISAHAKQYRKKNKTYHVDLKREDFYTHAPYSERFSRNLRYALKSPLVIGSSIGLSIVEMSFLLTK